MDVEREEHIHQAQPIDVDYRAGQPLPTPSEPHTHHVEMIYTCGEHGEAIPVAESTNGGYFAKLNREEAEVTPEKVCQAYEDLDRAEVKLFLAEESRIEAAIARETAYLAAISEAIADGITDPGRQQQKAQRATRDQLTALHQAEKASRQAQHGYKLAGIRLDSLNRRIQLLQLLQERSK